MKVVYLTGQPTSKRPEKSRTDFGRKCSEAPIPLYLKQRPARGVALHSLSKENSVKPVNLRAEVLDDYCFICKLAKLSKMKTEPCCAAPQALSEPIVLLPEICPLVQLDEVWEFAVVQVG